MTDLFDLSRKIGDGFDEYSYYQGLSSEQIQRNRKRREAVGFESPSEDNVFVEAGQAFMSGAVGALEGVGATANELGLGSGMQDYFRGVLNRNQQWNAPENMSVATYIARAVGNAGGSMAGQAAANYAGTVIGTAATGNPVAGRIIGFGSGLTVGFAQTFGNNVQRNREAGYGEGKSYGMAFLESTIDSTIENLPFGIVGKSGKLATNAGRVMRISQAGKSELLKLVGKKMSAEIGQEATQNLLFQWGKKTIKDGLGESGEECLQFLNSYVNQKLGGDPDAEFSIKELADAIAQGFIGGFILGGVRNISEVRQANRRSSTPATNQSTVGAPQTPVPAVAGAENAQTTPAEKNVVDNDQPLFDTLITDVGNALGINIDFMDSRPDGAELEEKNNGFYDKNNKTLYLNRNTYSVNPAETLGHELKHYIDDNIPELSKAFNSLLEAGKTEAGKQEVSEIAREFGITEAEGNVEFSADMFGKLFARPETWQKMAAQLDERTPGMGEKFLQTLRDFYALVKTKLADLVGTNPEAETFLNNVTELENEAARMLAELRRRNGNSTQVENVVGAKGNTAVETVPVSQINEEAGIAPQEVVSETEKTTAPEEVVSAENAQTTPAEDDADGLFDTQEATISKKEKVEPVVKENLTTETAATPKENLEVEESSEKGKSQEDVPETGSVEETPEVKSAYANLKDRSAEIGFTFDQFYEKYAPQLDAIIAKASNQFRTLGDEIVDDWRSASYEAMAKAYMGYNPQSGVKISTYATKAVVNAINEVNRKHKAETISRGGRVSLDQTDEQGKTLHEAVADENASAIKKEQHKDLVGDYRKWKSTLKPRDQKILDLSESGLSPSKIGRAEGIGMTTEEVKERLKELAAAARTEGELQFMRKRLRQQINPIVRDGKVRDEYADLLANKEYTPTTLKELQDKALEWILRRGGIVKAAQDILANKAPADPAVAEIARRFILNSDVFVNGVEYKDRIKLYSLEQNTRSSWGRAGRAMQLAALSLKDVASVQALLNKLHKDIPPADLQKLRNEISKVHGIDIFALPQNIVEDKNLLDAVLRAHLAHKAKWHDKLYEYWINAILSGPGTHISNFFGNTANAVYELGIKRFTEALVNIAAGRKDGATFGEFKAMIKAFNWSNACKAFTEAKNIEVLDPSGKFLENNLVAIGGKTGRIIRYPGRFLKAADAFAKALIQPMETAAYAYRMGVQEGLTGIKLQEYIQDQLTDKDSKAYQWANERAKELTFQEEPGSAVKWLMAMKESDGALGIILKMFLPFLKTPANILRQGVRKGPLGILKLLLWDTSKLALGKREFDGQYVARVAEQLLAWGAVMLFLGLDDEDDLPFITGSSAPYGSAEYGFKGNKIPPYSIRIGGSYYSYQRIEPFATSLALIADGIQALRNIKNGKDGTAVLNDVWRGAKQIVVDKSFFSTLGEINTALTSPDYIFRPVNNVVSGFVPKVVSQPLQALVPEVGESKSRNKGLDFIKDQFFLTLNRAGIMAAIPKVDYFGRDLQKDDWGDSFLSALGRLTSLKRITPDSHMDQAERLIWNYNQKNPDSEYYPSIPQHTFTYEGEQYYLAGKDYHDFAVEAGELAHRQILNAVNAGRLNVTSPSEQDIELIKNIFTRARRETRQKYINRAKRQR